MQIPSPESRANELRGLIEEVRALRWEMLTLEARFDGRLGGPPKAQRCSASNLIHRSGRVKSGLAKSGKTAPSLAQEPGPADAAKHDLMLPQPALAAGV